MTHGMERCAHMGDPDMLCPAFQRSACAGSVGACCHGVDPAGLFGLSEHRVQKIRTTELLCFCCVGSVYTLHAFYFSLQTSSKQAVLAPFQREQAEHCVSCGTR